MTTADSNSNTPGNDRDIDDVAEIDPAAKRGKMGQAAHAGDQAGPNSADAGKPQAPQTGNPRADDRQG